MLQTVFSYRPRSWLRDDSDNQHDMAMTLFTALIVQPLQGWLHRRAAEHRALDDAETDLRERFGAAAHGIAFCSSRQRGGSDHRRFWHKVASRLRRKPVNYGEFA